MKRVCVTRNGKKYYWWFRNVFTTDILKARHCTQCQALDFVIDIQDVILIDETELETVIAADMEIEDIV